MYSYWMVVFVSLRILCCPSWLILLPLTSEDDVIVCSRCGFWFRFCYVWRHSCLWFCLSWNRLDFNQDSRWVQMNTVITYTGIIDPQLSSVGNPTIQFFRSGICSVLYHLRRRTTENFHWWPKLQWRIFSLCFLL